MLTGVLLSGFFFAHKVGKLLVVRTATSNEGRARDYNVIGHVFFASADRYVASFDYEEVIERVRIDVSEAHFWDISAVSALDKSSSSSGVKGPKSRSSASTVQAPRWSTASRCTTRATASSWRGRADHGDTYSRRHRAHAAAAVIPSTHAMRTEGASFPRGQHLPALDAAHRPSTSPGECVYFSTSESVQDQTGAVSIACRETVLPRGWCHWR